jgi:hypothetical protein
VAGQRWQKHGGRTTPSAVTEASDRRPRRRRCETAKREDNCKEISQPQGQPQAASLYAPPLPPSFHGCVGSSFRVDAVWRRSTPGFTHRSVLGLSERVYPPFSRIARVCLVCCALFLYHSREDVGSSFRVDAVWRRSTPGFTHRVRLGLV